MLPKNRLLVLWIAASVAAALSGCGGGGGGGGGTRPETGGGSMTPGGGSTPTPSPTIQSRAQALDDPTTAANAADAITAAARARPAPGSVTQSSNVDSGNITTEGVEITAEHGSGGPGFSVRNATAWSIGTGDGNPGRIPGTRPPWQGVELSKRLTDGVLYVGAYTDIQAPQTRQAGGDDGTRDVALGTMIAGAGTNLSAGGNITGYRGTLNGERGSFNCDGSAGGCGVTGGSTARGMWTFTPDRPPGAVDVSSSDSVAWSGAFDSNRLPGTRNGQQGWFRCLSQSCGHSTSTVNGQSRMMLTGDWIFVPSTTTTVTTPDADYLAGGIWLIVPDDASSANEYVFGAFADGSDPFLQSSLAAVQGTATYKGDALGVYSDETGGSTEIGYFGGDIMLTADFGDGNGLGAISGSITNFEVDGVPADSTLNLGTASIGSQHGGFFEGAVTGSDNKRTYTGHWGGQFFGNGESDGRPGSVAGTFGGHSMDDAVNFVGAFGAHKQ